MPCASDRRALRLLCALLIVIAAPMTGTAPLLAQVRPAAGTLAGAVLDPDGKAVVGASVVIRNETSGEIRTATTDGAGHFSASSLNPGSYALEVFVPGFDTVRRSGIQLTGGNTEEIAIRLSIANITESVRYRRRFPRRRSPRRRRPRSRRVPRNH
jgi:hypothetical protein